MATLLSDTQRDGNVFYDFVPGKASCFWSGEIVSDKAPKQR